MFIPVRAHNIIIVIYACDVIVKAECNVLAAGHYPLGKQGLWAVVIILLHRGNDRRPSRSTGRTAE